MFTIGFQEKHCSNAHVCVCRVSNFRFGHLIDNVMLPAPAIIWLKAGERTMKFLSRMFTAKCIIFELCSHEIIAVAKLPETLLRAAIAIWRAANSLILAGERIGLPARINDDRIKAGPPTDPVSIVSNQMLEHLHLSRYLRWPSCGRVLTSQ